MDCQDEEEFLINKVKKRKETRTKKQISEKNKKYREKNKEKIKVYRKEWKLKNRDKVNLQKRLYRKKLKLLHYDFLKEKERWYYFNVVKIRRTMKSNLAWTEKKPIKPSIHHIWRNSMWIKKSFEENI